jgi:hypothetical protein
VLFRSDELCKSQSSVVYQRKECSNSRIWQYFLKPAMRKSIFRCHIPRLLISLLPFSRYVSNPPVNIGITPCNLERTEFKYTFYVLSTVRQAVVDLFIRLWFWYFIHAINIASRIITDIQHDLFNWERTLISANILNLSMYIRVFEQ